MNPISVQDSGHILVVDDNEVSRATLEKMLDDQGYRVTLAKGGQQALALLRGGKPDPFDVVLLDILMPEMDGYQLLQEIKSDAALSLLPVIMITAVDDTDSIVRCIEMGVTDYLTKPIQPALLRARLKTSLTEKRLHDLELHNLRLLERELEIGREIQSGFLPKELPQPEGWRIESYFQAARVVAGDFYDVFEVEQGKLAFFLGDVTDKGVGAALYMALIRTLLRATVMADNFTGAISSKRRLTPEARVNQAVMMVNRYICQIHGSAMFATLFVGILDTQTGKICYINAGQDVPFWIRSRKIMSQLNPTGPMIGIYNDATYQNETIEIQPGDSLVLYSDGITDALNPAGESFDTDRWRTLLQHSIPEGQSQVAYLASQVQDFICGIPQYDDISLLYIGRKP